MHQKEGAPPGRYNFSIVDFMDMVDGLDGVKSKNLLVPGWLLFPKNTKGVGAAFIHF